MGNTGKNFFFFLGLFVHAAVRGGTCALYCQHADQKELTRRQAFDLDIEATHGQPGSCWASPVNVDDVFEDIWWIRGLGGEKLPAASYALLSNLKKGLFFAIGEGSRNFVCFLKHPWTNVFVSDVWPAPAMYFRPCCERCDQRVGRSP